MEIAIEQVPLEDVLGLRDLYRAEMDCQIVHDSLHRRGFTHVYGVRLGGELVGYATVLGYGDEAKETVNEYFLLPRYRGNALPVFRGVLEETGAKKIQSQTNDVLLTLMLYDCARNIERTKILFHDGASTSLPSAGGIFREITESEKELASPEEGVPVGDWGIECEGRIVGSGGVLFHYNEPYGDIFMGVEGPFRRRGFGSYLVQELKRICRDQGKVPAARCDVSNVGSRATLQKAGMLPCASILLGVVAV